MHEMRPIHKPTLFGIAIGGFFSPFLHGLAGLPFGWSSSGLWPFVLSISATTGLITIFSFILSRIFKKV
jgi:hypothetical protein